LIGVYYQQQYLKQNIFVIHVCRFQASTNVSLRLYTDQGGSKY